MARFRKSPVAAGGHGLSSEHQVTIFERLDDMTRRAGRLDPAGPAIAVFCTVLAMLGLGFLIQASHAATTVQPEAFRAELLSLLEFRLLGLFVLLIGFKLGPQGVRPLIPALTLLVLLMLIAVYVPGLSAAKNGSRRWLEVPFLGLTVQPSEIARVVIVLWVASRCVQLGPRLQEMRTGYMPMLFFGISLFLLILGEPDLGGALLFFLCFVCTMWVGGARPAHVAGSLGMFGGGALVLGATMLAYVRERIAVWMGESTNDQVLLTARAMASGDMFGVGLTHGGARNSGVQYMQTDFALSLVGEELGFLGIVVVLGLLFTYIWFSLRLVLSIRDKYCALVAFGLLVSVAFQAMLHVQVVTGLAPPKGMNLPFISDGGSSLVASCLAVGLALGAVRGSGDTSGT